MQIILLEQVKRLGKPGEVVAVKNGYARNFLIPNGKAMRATKDNVAVFEARKSEIEIENKQKRAAASAIAKTLEGTISPIVRPAGDDGRLYGSVNAADIARALQEKTGQTIERKWIVLHNPIKYIGVHDIEVDLHAEVTATIHANVARTESEAAEAAERFARGDRVMEGPEGEEAKKAAAAARQQAQAPSATAQKKEEAASAAVQGEESPQPSEKLSADAETSGKETKKKSKPKKKAAAS